MTYPTGDATSQTGAGASAAGAELGSQQAQALLDDAIRAAEAANTASGSTDPAAAGGAGGAGGAGQPQATGQQPAANQPQAGGNQPAATQPQAAGQQPAANQPQAGGNQPAGDGGNSVPVNEHGFPDNTPWTQMSPDHQVAYWKHQARKHEQRVNSMGDYDQLRAKASEHDKLVEASKTDRDRAVEQARQAGRAEAISEAGGKLVEASVRSSAAGRVPAETVDAVLQGLDRSRFLNGSGDVDTDKVTQFVAALVPAAPPAADGQQPAAGAAAAPAAGSQPAAGGQSAGRTPDMGQGRREHTEASGLDAGRAAARARHGLDKQT